MVTRHHIRHDVAQRLGRDRLLEKIDRAEFHRADGVRHIAIGRDDDGWRGETAVAHLGEKIETIHLRHAHIEDREIESVGGQFIERPRAAMRFLDDIAFGFQGHAIAEPDIWLVVHDQNFCFHEVAPLRSGRQIEIEFAAFARECC